MTHFLLSNKTNLIIIIIITIVQNKQILFKLNYITCLILKSCITVFVYSNKNLIRITIKNGKITV